LLFIFALEHSIRKFQENPVQLKLNWTHQLLACADDMNLLGDNIDTVKKHIETLIDTSKEAGEEINVEKTKYMLLFNHETAGLNHAIKIANRSFENLLQFRYLVTIITS
jgi:hypothetical protein